MEAVHEAWRGALSRYSWEGACWHACWVILSLALSGLSLSLSLSLSFLLIVYSPPAVHRNAMQRKHRNRKASPSLRNFYCSCRRPPRRPPAASAYTARAARRFERSWCAARMRSSAASMDGTSDGSHLRSRDASAPLRESGHMAPNLWAAPSVA